MDTDLSDVMESQAGNSAAFGALYDRYLDRIYRFVYYKVWSKEIAEDLTSEVFTKAFQKINSFDAAKGSFSAWLYRIARNAIIDYYRTKKSTVPIDDLFDIGFDERTAEQTDALMALEKVEIYLKTLTPKQREIITLRIWEERSYKEIALIVGGTEDSVKMAFSRSIRDVREKCGALGLFLFFTMHSALLPDSLALPFKELS